MKAKKRIQSRQVVDFLNKCPLRFSFLSPLGLKIFLIQPFQVI
mgnify:CR=1 FL=1